MRKKIDIEKIQKLSTTEDMFQQEYGPKGTARREEFEAKARAWYYAEVLRDARKAAGMTQQQLADKIGKKREYVALLEKGETDMQLSTFLMISDAVGLKFELTLSIFHTLFLNLAGEGGAGFAALRAPHPLSLAAGALAKHCYQGVTRPGGRYFVSVQPLPKASFRSWPARNEISIAFAMLTP